MTPAGIGNQEELDTHAPTREQALSSTLAIFDRWVVTDSVELSAPAGPFLNVWGHESSRQKPSKSPFRQSSADKPLKLNSST